MAGHIAREFLCNSCEDAGDYHLLTSTTAMQLGLDVFWVLVVVTASGVSAQATVTSTQAVSLPTARPSDAFNVPADFPSVGFELAFLPGYNNNFSDNLVASLAQRMGVKPVLRIGGTSGYALLLLHLIMSARS